MRIIFYSILLIGSLFLGEWIYRSFVRPIDQPTVKMIALALHLNAVGIKGHLYSVRHGFRHSDVTAAAAFQIDGFPLPISFIDCPNDIAAESNLNAIKANPNLTHGNRKDTIVMDLPMWGDDTERTALKVVDAFSSFRSGT